VSKRKNIRKLREKYNGINLEIPLNFELQTPQGLRPEIIG